MKNLAEFLRQCDEIKAGAVDSLNRESLVLIENQLAMAMMHVRGVCSTHETAAPRPRMSRKQRHAYLLYFVATHDMTGNETYEQLETQANTLKREGFYSMSTGSADIVYRLRKAAKERGAK